MLSTANSVPHESFVTNLSSVISESSDIKIKIITSNIDPQSASEIKALPARYGGAGTGCSTEVVLFSPADKYEDPIRRAAYTSDVCAEFRRSGLSPVLLTEGVDITGSPVFVPVS